jgi:RHS repeat-associated protein
VFAVPALARGGSFPEPVALIDHTALGKKAAGLEEVLHYVRDELGNVVGLTDAGDPNAIPGGVKKRTGTARAWVLAGGQSIERGASPLFHERYDYDPYGQTYIEDPNGTRYAASRYGNPLAWTAQRYDAGVKLYGFFARTYSPELGRWLQRDPAGFVDGVNLYEYVASSPLNLIDPLGLELKVGGGEGHRKKVEDDLKKMCPQAQVNPETGIVSLNEPSAPKSGNAGKDGTGGKEPQGGDPKTDKPAGGSCSAGGDKSGDGTPPGGAPPSGGPGCDRLRNLIKSKTRYVVNRISADTEEKKKKKGGYFTPPEKNQPNAQIEYENKQYDIQVKGGKKTRKTQVWENLWHELTHADRHARTVYNDTDKGAEQVDTINEANSDLESATLACPNMSSLRLANRPQRAELRRREVRGSVGSSAGQTIWSARCQRQFGELSIGFQ